MTLPRLINIPRTETILAFGVLLGALWLGGATTDWGDLLMLVLGAYFGRQTRSAPLAGEAR